MNKSQFSQHKALLTLSDEALELADRHSIEERKLRYILPLDPEFHVEILRQIIDFDLTSKEIQQICEGEGIETQTTPIVTASKLRKKGIPLKKFKDTGPVSAVLKAAMSDAGAMQRVTRGLSRSGNHVSQWPRWLNALAHPTTLSASRPIAFAKRGCLWNALKEVGLKIGDQSEIIRRFMPSQRGFQRWLAMPPLLNQRL